MRTTRLIVSRRIALPEDVVFGALVDVSAQCRWMVATRVRSSGGGELAGGSDSFDGPRQAEVGSELVARTGFGSIGFDDTMLVCEIEPLRRWRVRHTGTVVRGWGELGVLPRGAGALVYWAEEFELPRGPAGRVGWAAGGWAIRWGIRRSLARLDRGLRSGSLIGRR